MDWYAEGTRWANRWMQGTAPEELGTDSLTHRRTLARQTATSADQVQALRGFNDRMRDFTRMSGEEMDDFIRNA